MDTANQLPDAKVSYTDSKQRTWIDLSDAEIEMLLDRTACMYGARKNVADPK
ncbi:hypothetical protein [Trueperella pyogenes]|uniref:hypothetical protein n=1 Tax=Trueperella pyogenes TaxID=1661 RepID=UPI00345C70BF